MKTVTHLYVSRKNALTWLMALCMVCSAVARILFVGVKGTDMWSQIVLPIVAALLYGLICLLSGKERFYKTAIPVWMFCFYYAFVFFGYDFASFDKLIGSLFAIALLFVGVLYTQISCGKVAVTALIIPLAAFPFVARLVEGSLREISPNIIETAQSMGATPMQILLRVMLPESVPSLISNFTLAITTIMGYTAMSGAVGGGGLGMIAITYGYNRYRYAVLYASVIVLVIIVQVIQSVGTKLAVKCDKRLRN